MVAGGAWSFPRMGESRAFARLASPRHGVLAFAGMTVLRNILRVVGSKLCWPVIGRPGNKKSPPRLGLAVSSYGIRSSRGGSD